MYGDHGRERERERGGFGVRLHLRDSFCPLWSVEGSEGLLLVEI